MKRLLFAVALGCFALLSSHLSAETYYVNANNPFPSPPYTNWATAATNIQDAVDAAVGSPGSTILVTNGIYQFGGATGNFNASRVSVNNAGITVQSVNGPAVTVIKGFQLPGTTNGLGAVRGVFLANGSTLSGFTVTGGATASDNYQGGGIYCTSPTAIVTNCIITGNASASFGGGVYQGTLNDCIISKNVANFDGGGAGQSRLNNCLVLTNSASFGGGVSGGSLTNCVVVGNLARSSGGGGINGSLLYNTIIYYNSAPFGGSSGTNVFNPSSVRNCCTTPMPLTGSGNITNSPGFVDLVGGNFRLQTGSPCIDAGTNFYAAATTDLDGNPRIVGAAVDIGAYENQNTNLIHYVSLSSTNPVAPFTNWLTAATNIQDAIGVAQPGEIVVAGAGAYTSGGVVMFGTETNRVALTNGITLLSVYGPASTMIVGGTQMRCAYVGSNSLISGFTITNGHTRASGSFNLTNEASGAGIWCEMGGLVANCLVVSNYANSVGGGHGGGIYGGTISNCTITGNIGLFGGGAGGGAVLWNCTITKNQSSGGGGAYQSAIYNCTVSSNTVPYNGFSGSGGGANQCIASNCVFTGNSDNNRSNGGGTYLGTNLNCIITGNWASTGGGTYQSSNYNCYISQNTASAGGGAYQATLFNCVLSGNQTTNNSGGTGGAGAFQSMLVNCTVANNTSVTTGGGVYGGTAYNSIIYSNSASGGGANWTNSPQLSYCCTTPAIGQGGITNAPEFVDAAGGDFRLKCDSPCIDTGVIYTVTGAPFATPTNDIRGTLRPLDGNGDNITKIDLGAYEFNQATENTPGIRALSPYGTFSTGYAVSFVAQLGGCADYYWWDFGDGTTITNQPAVSHAWSIPGTFNVRLSASYPDQVLSATTNVLVLSQPIYYVNQNNPNAIAPYTNWATAANTIQAAVNAGSLPGRLVLVTNGIYGGSGSIVTGTMKNSVVLTNTVTVQSINGPQVTTIFPNSGSGTRCIYVGSNAVLSGFTLRGGITASTGNTTNDMSGGGVWCEPGGVVSNCFIDGNRAYYSGAGAFQGTFYSCIFSNNQISVSGSTAFGAGAYQTVLHNCTVISNKISSAFPGGKGGGTYDSTLYNCTLTGNSVQNGDLAGTGGGAFLGTLYNCTLTGNFGSGYGGASCSNTLWNCTVSGNSANYGAGAFASTFYNCLVTGNTAINQGGGAYSSTFYNCTVASNSAPTGAGVYSNLRANNSIIYDNINSTSGVMDNWAGGGSVSGSNNCIYPQFLPLSNGNITNAPAFVNAERGDFHLQPYSRCINSGTNKYVFTATDTDGNPRIMGGSVDMGAYEFQSQISGTFFAWLLQYGLPTDGSADFVDSDGTGMVNWQKWIAGLNPTNAASVLTMVSALPDTNTPSGVTVTWQSVNTRSYYLQRGSDLSGQPIFTTIQSNIPGQTDTTSYTDTTATNAAPYFYRIGVH